MQFFIITIAIILSLLFIAAIVYLIFDKNWQGVAALMTFIAALIALFGPHFRDYLYRPILLMESPYYGHLRTSHDLDKEKDVDIGVYVIDVQLRNIGHSTARRTQVLLSSMSQYKDSKWQKVIKDWVPFNARWINDLYNLMRRIPTVEKDLISNMPYLLEVGYVKEDNPNFFNLLHNEVPKNTVLTYRPGLYCLELTAFAEGTEPITVYLLIDWKGGYSKDMSEMSNNLSIKIQKKRPWS